MSKVKYCTVAFPEHEAVGDKDVEDVKVLWSAGKQDRKEELVDPNGDFVILHRVTFFELPEKMTKQQFQEWMKSSPDLVEEKRKELYEENVLEEELAKVQETFT